MWNYKASDQFNKMVEDILSGKGNTSDYFNAPTVNLSNERVTETDKVVKLEIKLPGHTKDRIKVKYSKGVLTVKAESKDSFVEDMVSLYKVGDNVDMDELTTKLSKGILTIEIPFKESEQPKEYKVK